MMIAPRICYTAVLLWLVLRGVMTKERSQLKLFYATTKLLAPPCFYKACREKKCVTMLVIHRVVHGLKLLQPSSLPLMPILLANDVEINPHPAKSTRTDNNDMKVLYLNARSVKSFITIENNPPNKICKITLLQELVHSGDYEVICVCETWLNETVLDSELLLGFNVFGKIEKEKLEVAC